MGHTKKSAHHRNPLRERRQELFLEEMMHDWPVEAPASETPEADASQEDEPCDR